MADASIVSGELLVTGSTRGGEAIIDTFRGDGSYMVQVDVKLNSGTHADIWVRRTDAEQPRARMEWVWLRIFGWTIIGDALNDGLNPRAR